MKFYACFEILKEGPLAKLSRHYFFCHGANAVVTRNDYTIRSDHNVVTVLCLLLPFDITNALKQAFIPTVMASKQVCYLPS